MTASPSLRPSGSTATPLDEHARDRTFMLLMATVGFAINFWAWALLSPLAATVIKKGLTTDAALLVAVPVLVGSIGRIPIGALTDRFGGRLMFPLISVITIVPVLFLGFFGFTSYAALLVGGFFLGIAGTTFAIGVPYVNSWYPPKSRGTALGIYGMGMGGTAVSAFTTVRIFQGLGEKAPFLIAATALLIYAVLAYLLMRNAPGWKPKTGSMIANTLGTTKLLVTWQACFLYALSFGGYVAFSVYLPTFLINAYGLGAEDAALRMGGFVIIAVFMRAVGGQLSDRFGPVRTLVVANTIVAVMALIVAATGELTLVGTFAFLVMAMALGTGSGAVFGLVGQAADPAQVGSVTGFVGAAGGLGGFVPPLLLGSLWNSTGSYAIGLILLALTALVAVGVAIWTGRTGRAAADDPDADAAPATTTKEQ
ncbi:nitrate/nitrite transporter [Helcobacillus massiliensis]|uniref:NNP family nitrate/nitrite transporter-like MFS transporter n=2 Tax=Helcobacillus massiliensis TaxID=521392 RepID=A0A839QW64_9MICO|nr:NNP family nitrate/nitrite transporter-like MFS transporter [Helcobacillus massiliensis]